uniref:Uncharacterized protein n=1 Tax=Panagrolaimus sp. JU765 TaxID=591449 RepID=A0AC34QBD3_9BILA
MPETKKDSAKDPLLEKIMTKDRPFSLSILSGVFKLMFSIYDAIVYLPFKFFANPETKKALSKRIKAQPTIPNDPSSPWRNIKAIDKPLISLVFDDCPTLGLVWDRSVKLNSNINCMGWRDVIEIHHD